jgi:hypothetical protein
MNLWSGLHHALQYKDFIDSRQMVVYVCIYSGLDFKLQWRLLFGK